MWGQWAVQLGQYTASLHGGSGQCSSNYTLPQRLRSLGSETPANALPQHLRVAGSSAPAMRGPTSHQDGESFPRGVRCRNEQDRCNAPPHQPGALCILIPAMYCHTPWGQCAVQLLQYTASLCGGSGQWKFCNALPHRVQATGKETSAMRGNTSWGDGDSYQGGGRCLKSGTPAMHCHTALRQFGSASPNMHCHIA